MQSDFEVALEFRKGGLLTSGGLWKNNYVRDLYLKCLDFLSPKEIIDLCNRS